MLVSTTKLSSGKYAKNHQIHSLTLLIFSSTIIWLTSNTIEATRDGNIKATTTLRTTIKSDIETSSLTKEALKTHSKRHSGTLKEHGPKLIHQPQSVVVKANEPHTIECPVESEPVADVKWFKDDQLLVSQAPRLEQMGNELMFIRMIDDDTGDYHCEATNYLGSITSDHFRLTVQSTIHEPKIRFEPKLAEVGSDQQVEFTCTIPSKTDDATTTTTQTAQTEQRTKAKRRQQQQQQLRQPEVSWKRNGRRLLVKWLAAASAQTSGTGLVLENAAGGAEESTTDVRSRFVARQLANGNTYVLTITRTQLKDDNATFTCLYRQQDFSSSTNENDDDVELELEATQNQNQHQKTGDQVTYESSPVRLRVYANYWNQQQPAQNPNSGDDDTVGIVGKYPSNNLDANLGEPIPNLDSAGIPNELPRAHQNQTQLKEPNLHQQQQRKINSLQETLMDLYELAKPALVIIGLVSLVSMFVALQFVIIRRRNRQNRYMKHHQYHSSAGSGASSGSGGSATGVSSIDCDPVLNSLMARTLSAPSAASLSGAGKKFRSYRDHMRKVAAANDLVVNGSDLVDGHYFRQQFVSGNGQFPSALNEHHHQQQQEPFFPTAAAAAAAALGQANLYNQSLAAREQARNLLQASDHMRSLSNLNNCHKQQQGIGGLRLSQNGSHLNLPLSFAFGAANNTRQAPPPPPNGNLVEGSSQLMANALWQPHLAQMAALLQQQQQHTSNSNHHQQDEHYQLVNCSSISPSSTSSAVGGSSSNNSSNQHKEFDHHVDNSNQKNIAQNHYSIIENNDEDDRYEEVEPSTQPIGGGKKTSRNSKLRSSNSSASTSNSQQDNSGGISRTSTFVMDNQQQGNNHSAQQQQQSTNDGINQKSTLRSSLTSSNSSTSWQDSSGNSSGLILDLANNRFGSKRKSQDKQPVKQTKSALSDNKRQQSKFQDQLSPYAVSSICGSIPPPQQQPPPVTSEAMQALNEQFDINHLMMLDESASSSSLPFNAPPPPPLPQPTASLFKDQGSN